MFAEEFGRKIVAGIGDLLDPTDAQSVSAEDALFFQFVDVGVRVTPGR